jgi:hypothetical protein
MYGYEEFTGRLDDERQTRRASGQNLLKQADETDWEVEIARAVGRRLGRGSLPFVRRGSAPPLLHPSDLYGDAIAKKLLRSLAESADPAYARWRVPDRGPLDDVLPERYVTVRFYDSAMMRDPTRPDVSARGLANEVVRALAERLPVVLLDPGIITDPQHPDFGTDVPVVRLAPHLMYRRNLELQSIAIAHSEAFVGTFGGLAFVAPHFGVPSLGFWIASHRGVPESKKGPWRDLWIAKLVYNRPGWGGFDAKPFDQAPVDGLLDSLLAR